MDSSSIPDACSRCFQASQETLLLHYLLGSEQCLLHWVLASTVLQSSPPLLCKTCTYNQGRWTRPCVHSIPVDHQELHMQASSWPLCTSEVRRTQLWRCNLSCKQSSCRTLRVN